MNTRWLIFAAATLAVMLAGCATADESTRAPTERPGRPEPPAAAPQDQSGASEPAAVPESAVAGPGRGCSCGGPGFVDEDGDGVCDHYQSGDRPCGCGKGWGRGPGFVDEDGDGVCDHRQARTRS